MANTKGKSEKATRTKSRKRISTTESSTPPVSIRKTHRKTRSSTSFVDPHLAEKIDKLLACGVGNDVNLPQLVVVGQQSSGKSSVLEGLTSLPFPRDSGLCTRFATQITFRRDVISSVNASITPGKNTSPEHQAKVKAWSREMAEFDTDIFAQVMAEANEIMGVGPHADGHQSAFSKDVFNLVITGPEEGHFSVIDVPGRFKRTETGVTTKDDIAMVEEMVYGYMKNPRTIMLVVVPCNTDIATQDIIEKAEEVDPLGQRTLGILTKPDLIDRGAESAIVDIMEGRKHQLALGWHLLRNPGQADLLRKDGSRSRSSEESIFFETKSPWNLLGSDKVGVESLLIRLQDLLEGHLQREFPKVKQDIRQKLTNVENQLQSLGPKRQTLMEQTHYLSQTATTYRDIAEAARSGHYAQNALLQDERLRLATIVVSRSDIFAKDMGTFGQAFSFNKDEAEGDTEDDQDPYRPTHSSGPALRPPGVIREQARMANVSPPIEEQYFSRSIDTPLEIADLVSPPMVLNDDDLEQDDAWVSKLWHSTRGYEMGTFQSHLIGDMMQRQAKKWRIISMGYVSDIICAVHHFITSVLTSLVVGERSRSALQSLLMESLKVYYANAFRQTDYLVDMDLKGPPVTHDPAFSSHLETLRQARVREQVAGKAMRDSNNQMVVRLQDLSGIRHISNEQHTIREIHDVLRAYYTVALTRFVDGIRRHVIDHILIVGPESPLKLFSPLFVSSLMPAQVQRIGDEEPKIRVRRQALEQQIQRLAEGKRILQ
ncbi:dynamin GTPase [Kockovaella imperatae]|uniref:Dynamin GTPase n=1 Tax=Kockovaella imperatae TaxID=4999 RepID=A0A1Y1UAC3_9TREE|nr:dynamin GTPase [Kockovaella imperatae]ORX34446.1 dynamin GTPase [Kockovaella imperatae]